MTQEQITQNNKLIAEFMGDKHSLAVNKVNENGGHYYTSWDWLMPVVEKIGQMGNKGSLECPIRLKSAEQFKHCSIWSPIKAVYYDVVDFINWYNENT